MHFSIMDLVCKHKWTHPEWKNALKANRFLLQQKPRALPPVIAVAQLTKENGRFSVTPVVDLGTLPAPISKERRPKPWRAGGAQTVSAMTSVAAQSHRGEINHRLPRTNTPTPVLTSLHRKLKLKVTWHPTWLGSDSLAM